MNTPILFLRTVHPYWAILSCLLALVQVRFTLATESKFRTQGIFQDPTDADDYLKVFGPEQSDTKNSIFVREVGEWTYTLNKRDQANWPDAYTTCKRYGGSLIHFESKDDLSRIRTIIKDPELEDVEEFWSAGVYDKFSGKPGMVNIDKNYDMNFFKFLHGSSRCVSFATKRPEDTSNVIDLNYAFCMREKPFMCQEPRKIVEETIVVNETMPEKEYFEKEVNGWVYSMNLTHYATWMEAFENCKRRGASLISAAKYDQEGAWKVIKDPQLHSMIRFWSAGSINHKGEHKWIGKSTNLIEDSALLHELLDGKLNCIYHRIPSVEGPQSAFAQSLVIAKKQELPLSFSLCSTKMLYMCEEPSVTILRTDSEEQGS